MMEDPPRPVRIAEARTAIAQSVTDAITMAFTWDLQHRGHRYAGRPPSLRLGPDPAGHDAGRIPSVPETLLSLTRDAESPGVTFTWKVESGHPPYLMLRVTRGWLRDVVRPGHAVLGGHPVLQVLDRTPDGRPSQVLAVVITGHFDPAIHGWRAAGCAAERWIEWTPANSARLVSVAPQG